VFLSLVFDRIEYSQISARLVKGSQTEGASSLMLSQMTETPLKTACVFRQIHTFDKEYFEAFNI